VWGGGVNLRTPNRPLFIAFLFPLALAAKSSATASSISELVFDAYTVLEILLYASILLSGDNVASVIVHLPLGYVTVL